MKSKEQTELFRYGIQTEQSDIRAHVGPICKSVFVYQTNRMLLWLKEHYQEYRVGEATQPGVEGVTGRGFLVPLKDVPGLRTLRYHSYEWSTFPHKSATTSRKGDAAVDVVCKLLEMGRFPLWVDGNTEDRGSLQIKGTDIIVFAKQYIQVKCDYLAGPKECGCSGNLFVQTHESNPKKHT